MPASPAPKVEPLVRPKMLLGLLGTTAAALIVLFPGAAELKQRVAPDHPDRISIIYLNAIVAEHPEDSDARIKLAQQCLSLECYDEGLAALVPLEGGVSETAQQARLLSLRLDAKRWRALQLDDPRRGASARRIGERLSKAALAPPLDAAQEMIGLALELGREDLAATLTLGLANADPEHRADWLTEAGRHLVASGQVDRAAEVFTHAACLSPTTPGDPAFADRAMELLPSTHRTGPAVELAALLLRCFPVRAALLDGAVALAQARGALPLAQQWMRSRVALSPSNAALLARAAEIELATGDVEKAFELSLRLRDLRALSPREHERLGMLAEWAGDPSKALPEWTWLAERTRSEPALLRALALARALRVTPVVAQLLRLREQREPLDDADLQELILALEDLGQADDAERLLRTHLHRAPTSKGWQLLAALQERRGHLADALITREALFPLGMLQIPEAVKQAELLWRLDRPEEALERLRAVRGRAAESEAGYWAMYGHLAWLLDDERDALLAYGALRRAKRLDRTAVQRLLRLSIGARDPDLAITIAQEGYGELGEADLLLQAVEAAAQADQWDAVARALPQPNAAQKIARSERYWTLRARLAERDGRIHDALASAEEALALAPNSPSSRQLVIWLLIRQGDQPRLRSYLRQWQADAVADPSYWRAYATALGSLGDRNEARPWLESLQQVHPNDPLLLLEHASALEAASEAEVRKLQAQALKLLRQSVPPALQRGNGGGANAYRSLVFVNLVERLEGSDAAEPWVSMLLAQAGTDPGVEDWAIGWFVRREDFASVRTWIERKRDAGRPLPSWQRLALAYAQGDRQAVAGMVRKPPKDLSLADRFSAARYLGWDVAAWRMGREGLARQPEISGQLGPQVASLDEQLADAAGVTARSRSLGWLDANSLEVSARTARLLDGPFAGVLTARAAYRTLRASGAPLLGVEGAEETEIALMATLGPERWHTRISAGVNVREEGTLFTGLASQELELAPGVITRLELGANEVPLETPALRLLGTRHRFAASVSLDHRSGLYGLVTASGRRYQMRDAEELGLGVGAEVEVGRRFRVGGSELRLRGSTSWAAHQQAGELPQRFATVLGPGLYSPDAFLPPWLASAWVGASLSNGEPGELGLSSWRYVAEIAGGWLMPVSRPSYLLRLGGTAPLFPGAQLSATVGLANTLDGQPARSAEMMLSYRF